MNIREYEAFELRKKRLKYTISNALSTFCDEKVVCHERGWESDSVQRAIAINFVIKSIKAEMGVERMNDNGPRTKEIYHKYIKEAPNLLDYAVSELNEIDEDQKW